MALEDVPRCQHVKMNGTQCGSPALRRRRYCYFHNRMLDGYKKYVQVRDVKPRPLFSMCLLEDANAVQVTLMQVLQLIGCGQMDNKTAGLMLYGLQTASSNLRNVNLEPERPTDVVIDRQAVKATSIHGPQWYEEDFDVEDEKAGEGDAIQGDRKGEDECGIAAAAAEEAPKAYDQATAQRPVLTMAETRQQVEGMIHEWIAESVGQRILGKPS
jgi:hypothetical protein